MMDNTDISFIAAAIAFAAMAFTGWQAWISRKHNKLSVTPHLTIWESELNNGSYSYELRNNGIGPAIITSLQFFVDGELVSGKKLEPHRKIVQLLLPNIHCNFTGSYFPPGYMMPAGNSINLISISILGIHGLTKSELEASAERVCVVINYESIYGDKFDFDSDKVREAQKIQQDSLAQNRH
jgi:hypothetical protein